MTSTKISKKSFVARFRLLLACALLLGLSACQQMGATEHGVVFRRLPTFIGGGISRSVARPGETVFLMPWDSLFRFDTRPKDISWGSAPRAGGETPQNDFVYSRANDGNEVALAFTVRYRISNDPEKLVQLVSNAATSEDEVRAIVTAVGQSDIRRYMNELHTIEFLNTATRYQAVDKIREAMRTLLDPDGIEIVQVNLDDYLFERKLKDGTMDASYQSRLTEIQQLTEETEKEKSRMETVRAEQDRAQRAMEALQSQMEAEAKGNRDQAKLRGQAYFDTRANEAKAILARGTGEAQGIVQQVNALSGPGGDALLKLEIAKQLRKGKPQFVVMDHGKSGNAVDLTKMDANYLMKQLGALEALKDEPADDVSTRAEAPRKKTSPSASDGASSSAAAKQ